MDPPVALNVLRFIEVEGEEMLLMQFAEVAVWEVMALEGEEINGDGRIWVPVTVVINDHHNLGDPCFKTHFRMSRTVFEALTTTVFNYLVLKGRLRRERTPMQDILLMVVWLLATPDSFRSVALRFGVNPGTLYCFYVYIIQALRELAPRFISWPKAEERVVIREAFQEATGFPGVIGCIDCTHVQITAPLENKARYTNRHHQYSINVQTVVDHNLLTRQLHVGEAGSLNDRRIFRRSPLLRDLLLGPPDVYRSADEHLVGDGAYVLTDFMMIPFPNNGYRTAAQINFNVRLSQCRVRVENSYALAKGKWRRLQQLYVRKPDVAVDHITASFVLNNFIILNGEPLIQEGELRRPLDQDEVNEIFGNANEENVEEEEEDNDLDDDLVALHDDANVLGIEKRIHIMDWGLPPN